MQDNEKKPALRFKGFTDPWEQRKVREVTDRYDNLRIPVAASLRVAGTTPYYGANGIQDYVEGYTHDGEFILVAEDGANDLKNYPVKCVKGRIWVNNHAHVLQGKCACADNQFLAYAISQADIESLLVGGGRAKLNAETLMDIELLLPSKDEQIQIGHYLARLDHLITLHQRKYEKLVNIKKSMLDKMFPQNGASVPEIRFKGFTDPWEQRKLGELGTLKNGMNFSKAAMGIGYPFVNLQNIFGKNVVDISALGKAMASLGQLKDYSLLKGDVLFVRSSVKLEGVGEAALVPESLDKTTYYGFIIRFRDEEGIDNNYKRFVFATEQVRNQIISQATDSANKNISQSVLADLDVPLPELEEQSKIGQYFSDLDTLITLHQRKLEKLQNIKKSCLEKMFV